MESRKSRLIITNLLTHVKDAGKGLMNQEIIILVFLADSSKTQIYPAERSHEMRSVALLPPKTPLTNFGARCPVFLGKLQGRHRTGQSSF